MRTKWYIILTLATVLVTSTISISLGYKETAPGQTGTAPGLAKTTPGQAGTVPGQGEYEPPGQMESTPGQQWTTPGQSNGRVCNDNDDCSVYAGWDYPQCCNGQCVDTGTDEYNCGQCGEPCDPWEVCDQGYCNIFITCPIGQVDCFGHCVNLQTNLQNCGACGNDCLSYGFEHPQCCNGQCIDAGTGDNCGACGQTCTADASKHVSGAACSGGVCVVTSCSAGWDDCDHVYSNGCEIQINDADINNCGACGNYCPGGRTCDNGVCSQCPTGQTECEYCYADPGDPIWCGPSCVDTQTDEANCGACDSPCDPGESCVAGACTSSCPAGETDCDGVCVDTQTDSGNCGACGNICPDGVPCCGGWCCDGLCCSSGDHTWCCTQAIGAFTSCGDYDSCIDW